MKVIGLIGSLREQSHNRKVFEVYRNLATGTFELTEGRIGELPLYNQDLQNQGFPAPVQRLIEQVQEADAVMFFSPEFNYSVPAALKNAIDWLSRAKPMPFAGKPAAIIGASTGRLGSARMQYHLRQIGVSLDLHFLNKPEVMVSSAAQVFDEQGNLTDDKTEEVLEGHVKAFADFARIFAKRD